MNRITFFTKPDCSLCRGAMYVVSRVRNDHHFELDVVDISSAGNEKWAEAYRDHIPVIHLNGREIFRHRVDEKRLREWLAKSESAV